MFHSPERWEGFPVAGDPYAQRYSKAETGFGFLTYFLGMSVFLSKQGERIHEGTRPASFQGDESGRGKQTRIFRMHG